MPIESGSQFLKQQYNLHNQPEVQAAVKKVEATSGERIARDPAVRIQIYLDRLQNILDPAPLPGHEQFDRQSRNLSMLKEALYRNEVIKADQIPESYWDLQRRIIREMGREADFPKDSEGRIEIPDEVKEQIAQTLIDGQIASLNKWVDYLTSPDADYPNWAKYWAIRSVLGMGKLIKEERENGEVIARFSRRTAETVAPFPPLNPRALALTIGLIRSRLAEKEKPKVERQPIANPSIKLSDEEFKSLLATESFAKLYTQFLIEMPEYSAEGLQETRGRWVKYDQGTDATALVQSLEGYPLEWCTADLGTAEHQLQGGDFYVYYSLDEHGQAKVPRAAIRMEEDQIAEVRGVAPEQNLDPYIADVVREKMKEFPDGAAYENKAYDMQMLTYIDRKTKAGQQLTKDDLIFLYEINGPIEGFGYERDPRIEELRSQRNPEEDAPIVFECTPQEIAHRPNDITETTKAYIGPLERGIFTRLPRTLEHVYTAFPKEKIRRSELTIGGKTKEQLTNELRAHNINISPYAEEMIKSPDFTTLESPEPVDLIRIKVADLGFTEYPTTDQLYVKAAELGLELCPAEVGPHQRLLDANRPLNEWYYVAMKQIPDRGGYPLVFRLGQGGGGPWLGGDVALPANEWNLGHQFVFRVRKLSPDT